MNTMGFFDVFKKGKNEPKEEVGRSQASGNSNAGSSTPATDTAKDNGSRIKKYTSEGKPTGE